MVTMIATLTGIPIFDSGMLRMHSTRDPIAAREPVQQEEDRNERIHDLPDC
jgi:hypothetical protein